MQSLPSFRTPVSNKSMGIELECFGEFKNLSRNEYNGFFYVSDDVSIRTNRWFEKTVEFVSQPLTPSWLKREITRLQKRVGEWSFNDSCGIHIHVSRKWLSEQKAERIYNVLKQLSFDECEQLFGRVPNDYCEQRWSKKNRYTQINITNKNTIEFRMFASGNAKWACYCVDMAEFMVRNATVLTKEGLFAASEMFMPK